MPFSIVERPIDAGAEKKVLQNQAAGGFVSFEGWVRNFNEGRKVSNLEYQAYQPLALKEGCRIVKEAMEQFGIFQARCVHRVGFLELGEIAVWIGVASEHRSEAFRACQYIIDEVKHRVPLWKKEHYVDGNSGWVRCERCAEEQAPRPASNIK